MAPNIPNCNLIIYNRSEDYQPNRTNKYLKVKDKVVITDYSGNTSVISPGDKAHPQGVDNYLAKNHVGLTWMQYEIVNQIAALDGNKGDLTLQDLAKVKTLFNAKNKKENRVTDIKYDAKSGVATIEFDGIKGKELKIDIETDADRKRAKANAQKKARAEQERKRREAELDRRYADEHPIRNFFGITRKDYEKNHKRDY